MRNFYLDLFQRLTIGKFSRYVTFHKNETERLLGPLETLPIELVEVEKFTLTNLLVRNLH